MSYEGIARLMQEHAEAIAALHRQIATHENIRRILENLDNQALIMSQALIALEQNAARITEPARELLYRQTIERVQQMQPRKRNP